MFLAVKLSDGCGKEGSTNNCCRFMAIFIVFPGFCLKQLQEPLREPCNQREIAAVIFRQFLKRRDSGCQGIKPAAGQRRQ